MAKPFTILVTGGAGYIGSHAVFALRDAGWPVAVVDNLTTGFRWAVPEGIAFYEGDIEDSALLARIIKDENIGAIMHFAGSIIVPESVENPLKYYHNNSAKSRSLIESAVTGGVHHFIFSSTAATYGMPEESPVSETTPQLPINPYGMSKLMTEHMLRDVAAAHDLNFCALRYFNVAGADPQARTGQSTAGATHLIKVAVEAALGKRDSVAVFGTDYATPDGTGVRDYIHVVDLARAHVAALDRAAGVTGAEVYNIGTGRGTSVREMVAAFSRAVGRALPVTVGPRRPGDIAAMEADCSLARQMLGWQAQYGIDDMARSLWVWQSANPEGYRGAAGESRASQTPSSEIRPKP